MKEILLKYHMDSTSIIKYQLINWCYMNGLLPGDKDKKVSFAEIDCMTLIGIYGTISIMDLCEQLVKFRIYSNEQSVRNAVCKLNSYGLVDIVENKGKGAGRKAASLAHSVGVINTEDMSVAILLSTDKQKLAGNVSS